MRMFDTDNSEGLSTTFSDTEKERKTSRPQWMTKLVAACDYFRAFLGCTVPVEAGSDELYSVDNR